LTLVTLRGVPATPVEESWDGVEVVVCGDVLVRVPSSGCVERAAELVGALRRVL